MPLLRLVSVLVFVLGVLGHARAAPLGQWVWSRADVGALEAARGVRSDIEAAVHVAEVRFVNGAFESALRLPPRSGGQPHAAVIRFHASVHDALRRPEGELVVPLAQTLFRVLAAVRNSVPELRVVQLDC